MHTHNLLILAVGGLQSKFPKLQNIIKWACFLHIPHEGVRKKSHRKNNTHRSL